MTRYPQARDYVTAGKLPRGRGWKDYTLNVLTLGRVSILEQYPTLLIPIDANENPNERTTMLLVSTVPEAEARAANVFVDGGGVLAIEIESIGAVPMEVKWTIDDTDYISQLTPVTGKPRMLHAANPDGRFGGKPPDLIRHHPGYNALALPSYRPDGKVFHVHLVVLNENGRKLSRWEAELNIRAYDKNPIPDANRRIKR